MSVKPAPLAGVRVVVTRAAHQQEDACAQLRALGAEPISAPTIKLAPPPPPSDHCYQEGSSMMPIAEAGQVIERFDWLIFTSANAVRHAHIEWANLGGLEALLTSPLAPQVICVGTATQRVLRERTSCKSILPRHFHAEGVIELLSDEPLKGQHVLIPRALKARETLPIALRSRGAEVWIAPVYQTLPERLTHHVKDELLSSIQRGEPTYLTFTSDSTLNSFLAQWTDEDIAYLSAQARWIVIGPVVERAARAAHVTPHQTARPHTWAGVIHAIVTERVRG